MVQTPAVRIVLALGLLAASTAAAAAMAQLAMAEPAVAQPAMAAPAVAEPATSAAPSAEVWRTGEILPRVTSKANPGQTYALYLPPGYQPGKPLPILYCFDARQRGAFAAERFRAAAELAAHGEPVPAARRYLEIAHDFTGLRDVASAVLNARRIEETPEHRAAIAAEESAEREAEDYIPEAARILRDALADLDSVHLPVLLKKLRVPALRQRAAVNADTYTGQAAARLLEVLYVQTSYDIPGELEKKKDYARAALSLRVATEVKPEHPGAWFALACALAPDGDTRGAVAALDKALSLGFDDTEALTSEPALERLRTDKAFRELLDRMKRRADAG